jgi:hypothetical protein
VTEWVIEQLELLRTKWPDLTYHADGSGHWVLLPGWPMTDGWSVPTVDIACQIPSTPEQPPYAFYVNSQALTFEGSQPSNWTQSAAVPFTGSWSVFSWAPETWRATGVGVSSNMLTFVRSFSDRLAEGA